MIPLIDIGFLPVRVWDVLDIIIVTFLLYSVYRLLRGSIAFNIVIGIILLYVLWGLVGILEMPLLSEILGQFISVGFISLIIIFQPEIRRFLLYLGKTTLKGRVGFFNRILKTSFDQDQEKVVDTLHNAMVKMAKSKTGALIVIQRTLSTDGYEHSGKMLKAKISEELILSVFQKRSPLHDGAMIIFQGEIYAASCILPVSSKTNLPTQVGLRHRAALGASEQAEVAAFIVSEETGTISFAFKGTLELSVSDERLRSLLKQHYI